MILPQDGTNEEGPVENRRSGDTGVRQISWDLSFPKACFQDELDIKRFLILNRHESGRGCELPTQRQELIEREALARGFSLTGALSLRRQYIRQAARGRFDSRDMGDNQQAKAHADSFERATELFLRQQCEQQCLSAEILTEEDLKSQGMQLTPDFVFANDGICINGKTVYWLDCKTYYGSSSLVNLSYLPIGKLKKQTDKYCEAFGPGAFVFLNGFSHDLAEHAGFDPNMTLLLDATPLDISKIHKVVHKEEVPCSQKYFGLVKGKHGRMLKSIIDQSGCRVVIHEAYERVVVTGTSLDQVQRGAQLVQDVLCSAYERVVVPNQMHTVVVPNEKVAEVIGKQGRVVKEITRRTGCKIETSRDSLTPCGSAQFFVLSGTTSESIQLAETLIQAVIEVGKNALTR